MKTALRLSVRNIDRQACSVVFMPSIALKTTIVKVPDRVIIVDVSGSVSSGSSGRRIAAPGGLAQGFQKTLEDCLEIPEEED
jgi:hypothetical protein